MAIFRFRPLSNRIGPRSESLRQEDDFVQRRCDGNPLAALPVSRGESFLGFNFEWTLRLPMESQKPTHLEPSELGTKE